jgi:tRNA nucleotidyltransferase (CCA-adding enzyme)
VDFKPGYKTKLEKEGLKIVKLFQKNGFKAFWVGGTVRDLILKRPIDNLDIATNAKPDETEKLLAKKGYNTKPVGKTFGTILAATKSGPVEITTFRKEGRYLDHRKPSEITYIDSMGEDSARRDFTVNAMYLDPVKGEILDPQGGAAHIESKLLKFVGDPKKRIDEDALRMLRAVRFSAQLNFKLEKNSFAAIKTRAKFIQHISGERIKAELDKICVLENKDFGFRLLDEIGLLKFIMPEVYALKKTWHKSKMYHLEGSAFEHTALAVKNIKPGDASLAYAAAYHDAGKALTATPRMKEEGMVNSFPKHEFVSGDLFKNFAKRLKFSRHEKDLVLWITRMHMKRVAFVKDMSEAKKLELVRHKYFPQLLELWRADSLSNLRRDGDELRGGNARAYEIGLKMLNNISKHENLIKKLTEGKFLIAQTGIRPGPKIGELKNILSNKIILNEIKNISDAKKFLKKFAKSS